MQNPNQLAPKVFGYFRVGNKSQLDANFPQLSMEKTMLDNQPEDANDIDIGESDSTPDMQIGG